MSDQKSETETPSDSVQHVESMDSIDIPSICETNDPANNDPPSNGTCEQTDSPLPHVNIEPHLESNLNVIENQNNENLERDLEQMEHNEEENTESKEAESQDLPESLIDNDTSKSENINDDKQEPDTVETDNDQCDISPNTKELEETPEPVETNNTERDNSKTVQDPDIQCAEIQEGSESATQKEEDENISETNVNAENELEQSENDPSSNVTDKKENEFEKSPEPIKDIEIIEKDEEKVNYSVQANKYDAEGGTKIVVVTENDNKIDNDTEDKFKENEDKLSADDKSDKSKTPEEIATTAENEIDEGKPTEDLDIEKAKPTEQDTQTLATPSESVQTDASELNKNDESASRGNEDTTDTNKAVENGEREENIEFAQVNFETDENEKGPEEQDIEKEDTPNKDLELDPIASEIASDVFDSVDDSAGADEELCIIPDTEREISQAEKDAAATIPPLKDICEASVATSTPESSEAEASDGNKIMVFRYDKDDLQKCHQCLLQRKVMFHYTEKSDKINFICDNNCLNAFKKSPPENMTVVLEESGSLRVKKFIDAATEKEPPSLSFIRKCASCKKITNDVENNLTWEIMDFCNEFCLSKYQREIGSKCSTCEGVVKSTSLGKYCVRFGNDIRQFCSSSCLEQYKKGLKVCSYCQQDMSNGPKGFLAPVGEKGQFKDFCSKLCMEKYDIMTNDRPPKVDPGTLCSVCKTEKLITIEYDLDGTANYFCGEPCFVAFSFVNNISPGRCAMCRRNFSKSVLEKHTMYYDNVQHSFCSNSCENIYIIAHRRIVPCSWCKVKKYNFDMIKKLSKAGPLVNMCSINCLSLYQVSLNAVNSRRITCNYCQKSAHPMYHLTMSDATIRNFCCYVCVMSFQNQFPKQPITLNTLGDSNFPVPTGTIKKNKKCPTSETAPTTTAVATTTTTSATNDTPMLPIISSVQSLASTNGIHASSVNPPGLAPITSNRLTRSTKSATPPPITTFAELPVQIQVKQHFIVRPVSQPEQRNVATMCSVRKAVKGVQVKTPTADVGVQTEKEEIVKILIPVPVPIYVPTPCHMFSVPVPVPVPFPIPVPVPIFIPTTRNSAAGIMKEIKKIQVKIPTDPYEAELLMMAEMVAEEKKEENTDSESDIDDPGADGGDYSPEPVDASNTFGDDMLQMALKMATELDEPAVDLEGALTANTITAQQAGHPENPEENVDDPQPMHHHMIERGRKRGMRGGQRGQTKRGRRMSHHQVEMPMIQQVQQPPPAPEPQEKPDANMCLKYTFGVNAWKQWVTTKNAELEKSSRRVKLFKTEILQLTADELNYSLCLFVKEVRKPNGQEYAPDTIYYLCLGIQQYLFENGRIDNIFCDPYYEKFTDCLDEVAKKFSVLYNDSHYIVTRVEEEHLWESKQLGAHSPHVLLSTLMFFNTKHFNLTSVDEHMQLSFSHIMKHWKRNPNQPGASKVPGSRNVLLRFYPPQAALQHNQRKKKVYEQQENEENPLRCPVKLYEFYLSKCPESVKTRNDVFYLQPERSCVPDSPVWYSTMPLPREALEKMLHRVKMVKEINVALLTS